MSRARAALPQGIARRVCTALTALTMLMALPTAASAAQVRLFIDPGHGGSDPGAVAGGLAEKDSNLRISKMMYNSARRQGWAVKMSRTGDYFVPLNERPRRANRWKANVLVSVHSNSMGKRKTGHMTIYRSGRGSKLGWYIMRETGKLTPYRDIGNRRDVRGLAVLRGAKQPAVIVEALSVAAPSERAKLKNTRAQRQIAEAIVRGIAKDKGVRYVPPGSTKAKPVKPKAKPKPAPKAVRKPVRDLTPEVKPDPAEKPIVNGTSTVDANAALSETPQRDAKPAPKRAEPEQPRVDERPSVGAETIVQPRWLETIISILTA